MTPETPVQRSARERRHCRGRTGRGRAGDRLRHRPAHQPLQTRLRELWLSYNRPREEWASQPAWLTGLRAGEIFGQTVELSHTRDLRLPAETVMGVERTRATFLSWPGPDQAAFTAGLQALLDPGVAWPKPPGCCIPAAGWP